MTQFCGIVDLSGMKSSGREVISKEARRQVSQALTRNSNSSLQVREGLGYWMATIVLPDRRGGFIESAEGPTFGLMTGDPLVELPEFQAVPQEVLPRKFIRAILERDRAMLQRTCGSFAVAAIDPSNRLVLAVDKLANRSLYYQRAGNLLAFSTSIRLLRLMALTAERVDEQGMAEVIFLGQPLGSRTALAGISVLTPGEMLTADRGREPAIYRYHDFASIAPAGVSFERALESLHRQFSLAVKRRAVVGLQEAFLSGGMDSRSVAAELVDQGHPLATFCACYEGSADEYISQQVSMFLNTDHQVMRTHPEERVRVSLDPFALYAKENFVQRTKSDPRRIWSGDGGSVTLGHVYMSEKSVNLSKGKVTPEIALQLFPSLARRPSRHLSKATSSRLSELALQGVLDQFRQLDHAAPDRRLFFYYMYNDQCRHLYHHYELMDIHGIEFLTPFFDGDFVAEVSSMPTEWFLGHRLYNDWLQGFRCDAGSLYWQSYPGHIGCPHPAPANLLNQWSNDWYSSPRVNAAYVDIANDISVRHEPLADEFISRMWLRFCAILCKTGSAKLNYEIEFARNVRDWLGSARG